MQGVRGASHAAVTDFKGGSVRMRLIKNLVVVTLPALLLFGLFCELFFRFVVPAAEFPYPAFDHASRVLKFDPARARTGVYTLGLRASPRARWRINDEGWNSSVEYFANGTPRRPRIVIVGDSYVEAVQVDVDRNFGALARKGLGGSADVYTLGVSGASLSQYLQMSRYARNFRPDVLVINVVHNDFGQSVSTVERVPGLLQLAPDGAGFREVPAAYTPGGVRRFVRLSATARYLIWNGKILELPNRLAQVRRGMHRRGFTPNANIDAGKLRRSAPLIRRAVFEIARKIRAENPGTRIIYMMDGPRADIYAGTPAASSLAWLTRLMKDAAEANGASFVDLTPAFSRYWAAERRSLNFARDGHWNEAAHALAAEALLAELSRPVPGAS